VTGTSEPLEYWKDDLESYASSHFSQGGEDGVLLRLFERIGVAHRYFVEFGAWDGQHWSNTANLRINHDWQGLLMEGSDRADGSLVAREFVSADNIEALLAKYDVPSTFDLLSIDIDGNDYWVWKAISSYSPRVVIVEYNVFFRSTMAKVMAYDANHDWNKDHHARYHGASLAAFDKLAREKGYALLHTDVYCPNAIFVRRDLLAADVKLPSLAEFTRWDWAADSYVEPTPKPGGAWVEV